MRLLFKILGLAIIMTVCTAAGFLKAVSLKKRYDRLIEIKNGLSVLKEKLRLRSGDKSRLLRECFSESIKATDNLKADDVALWQSFLKSFGNGDTNSELQRCDSYIGLLDIRINDAKNEFDNQSRLYKSLGFLCGIFICIFFS